ncbi:hypothetical protein BCY86_05935 [Pajaroellobacter abortibovis]|uniref:DUF192 domain-containing protein n=1 Tax=Pajaroellobacter abortibovis TaxID=1882918 RepID=A0A1L6MZB6_9BACT|nr:hypothetical protein BCY86_05935 [Pajaroellobacter abortibovis]
MEDTAEGNRSTSTLSSHVSFCPAAPTAMSSLSREDVIFMDAPGQPIVHAELAQQPSEIERGLMYRLFLGEREGMLFRFQEEKEHLFWMHNTCISLDMIFLNREGRVTHLVKRAPILTDTLQGVGAISLSVLEVNAGWAVQHGVQLGQRVLFKPCVHEGGSQKCNSTEW